LVSGIQICEFSWLAVFENAFGMVLNSILDETGKDWDSIVSLLGKTIIYDTPVFGTGNSFDEAVVLQIL
jgi:hypothetical protein